MSKKQEHSVPLSPKLLQKYREGKLSAQEMHRVERLLLEDPFYADAMEGLDKLDKNAELDTHLADLHERLHQRVSGDKKTVPLYRTVWQIAAAVVLLVIGSWVAYNFYFTNSEEQEQLLSMQNEPSVASKPIPAPLRDEASEKEIAQVPDETTSTENSLPSNVLEESTSPENNPLRSFAEVEVTEEQATTPILPDSEAVSPLAKHELNIDDQEGVSDQHTLAISKVPEENFDQSFRSSEMLNSKDAGAEVYGSSNGLFTLKGTVISSEGKTPLPGVNVVIKNSTIGTVTDINGDFKLTVPESQNEVEFSFIGFHAREKTVSQSDSNTTVVLIPDKSAQLSEVVVTGRERQEKKSIATTQAKPVGGYASYKIYLQKNLQYPQTAKANNIEGVVSVSFDVTPYSEPQNFSIKKSVGYGCDEEAIRLIKEGPAWEPATSNGNPISQNVTVKVQFSLKE